MVNEQDNLTNGNEFGIPEILQNYAKITKKNARKRKIKICPLR